MGMPPDMASKRQWHSAPKHVHVKKDRSKNPKLTGSIKSGVNLISLGSVSSE